MDKFPLLWDGRSVGELTTEREALYTWYEARCRLPEKGLWCGWVSWSPAGTGLPSGGGSPPS